MLDQSGAVDPNQPVDRNRRLATWRGTVGHRPMKSVRLAVAGVSISLASSGCTPKGPPSPYQVLGEAATPLRDAFNANVGKVRVVMLVAPT